MISPKASKETSDLKKNVNSNKKQTKKPVLKPTKLAIENIESEQGQPTKPKKDSNIFNQNGLSVSDQPHFEGGTEAFFKFIGDNYIVPNEKGLKGKIFMQFIIEKDGSLADIKCLKDIGFGSGQEAIRVLKTSPKWKPGYLDGKPVQCTYQLPIAIESPE